MTTTIEAALDKFSEPLRTQCLALLATLQRYPLSASPGSKNTHHAWTGGYLDHVSEVLLIAEKLYSTLDNTIGDHQNMRRLPFELQDAQLVLFLHDLEKPYKYALGLSISKAEAHEFRLNEIANAGITLTLDQRDALKYVEGEGNDYTPDTRVMNPLAAFCHMCDVCSARIWHDEPKLSCKSCDEAHRRADLSCDVCKTCWRDPETNNCSDCGVHLTGINYEYVCGTCAMKAYNAYCNPVDAPSIIN